MGKNCLVDGSAETCWTSQEGLPQHIQFRFASKVTLERVLLTFQGGFVGTKCAVQALVESERPSWNTLTHVYPEDVNRQQKFELDLVSALPDGTDGIRLVFERSSDFFGRITIYDLKLQGTIHP